MAALQNMTQALKTLSDALRFAKHTIAYRNGLNTSELEVLVSLYNSPEPLSIKNLSSDLMLCSQAITKIAKNLNALGLLESRKSTIDRRITWIELTAKGAAIAKEERDFRESLIKKSLPSGTKTEPMNEILRTLSDNAMAASIAIEG
jgi:DNA-binding MarR family transcriptional regulator